LLKKTNTLEHKLTTSRLQLAQISGLPSLQQLMIHHHWSACHSRSAPLGTVCLRISLPAMMETTSVTTGEAESALAKVADLETLLQEREALIAHLEEDLLAAKPGSKSEAKEATILGTAECSEAGGKAFHVIRVRDAA